MSKILVIFGATGQQGGSVIDSVLKDPELSKVYKIRALTRDVSQAPAKALQDRGVEVLATSNSDATSLHHALAGAHTAFINIATISTPTGRTDELTQGKLIASTAVTCGLTHLIYSSSTNCTLATHGKLSKNWIYDVKAEIEAYIRTLPISSTFYIPGSFMQNFHTQFVPRPAGDGTYTLPSINAPSTSLPLIDITDTGKWISGILSAPAQYYGKSLRAATGWYTSEEIAETMSKVSGKTIKHVQIPEEVFKGFLPAPMADALMQLQLYNRDYCYFGDREPDREGVKWAGEQARGELTGFEEYLRMNPLRLE